MFEFWNLTGVAQAVAAAGQPDRAVVGASRLAP